MEPSSNVNRTLQETWDPEQIGFALIRSNPPRKLNPKRTSEGDALHHSRKSLMIAEETLKSFLVDSTDDLEIKSIRKTSSPENLITQRSAGVAQTILAQSSSTEPTRLDETTKGKSYDKKLIKRSVEEQSRKEMESPPTSQKLSRKASAFRLKRSLNRTEADSQRLDINAQFMQIFNAHGHYNSKNADDRTKNLEKWISHIETLRDVYTDRGIQREIDIKVAGLVRISLVRAYIQKIDPPKETIKAMILEFYTQTIYHHHKLGKAVKHLLDSHERFPEDLVPLLEETIIQNAPPPHLAHYLFKRIEQEGENKETIDFFAQQLIFRKRKSDVTEFFGILFENDISLQQNSKNHDEFLQTLFRGNDHLSIKLLQAYERVRFPSVIDNLLEGFKKVYSDIVNPHKGLRNFFKRGKQASDKEEESLLGAFQKTIETFCADPMQPELAQILRIIRTKLDAVLGKEHPNMALNIVSSIFVLRLLGNAAAKHYATTGKQKDPKVVIEDSKPLIKFSKWLIKCLEYVFEEDIPQLPKPPANSEEAEKKAKKGRFTVSKEAFSRFMNQQTGSLPVSS